MPKRMQEIDVLKGLVIIAVIVLHALPARTLQILGAPFSFEQAVPLFMMLMGFQHTMTFEQRGGSRLRQLYSRGFLRQHFRRILSPSLAVFLIEAVLLFIASGAKPGFPAAGLLNRMLHAGGYFIPVALQARLVLPLIYRFLKKTNGWGGIAGLFLLSFLADHFGLYLGETFSRLFIGRYLFAMALGIYLFFNKQKLTLKRLALFALFSLVSILLAEYAGSSLVSAAWGSQHTPAYFWTLLLAIGGLRLGKALKGQKLFAAIGKASYHIFLVQHLYFYVENIYYPIPGDLLNMAIAVPLCLAGGFLYHRLDRKMVKTKSLILPGV